MTNKDFKEGMEVDCELNDKKVYGAKLHKCGGNWYIYATRNGIAQSWHIGDGSNLSQHGVTNLQPKFRTIDDLEEGDIIVDKDGYKKKCLAKCGEVYALSYTGEGDTVNEDKRSSGGYTLYELKEHGFTLYQEPIPTDDTIEIEGVKYKASEVKEALKNFKK